ncbi:Ubiquitin carboxyl-terminal hydrolase 1 [Hondaea fermentalgiana]|uniref:Ubiquitin carboxyl-terminal hydrolase n=1 Tax=Hondaea fermentalgiana TaxID=2315210 RepID=A0A2R5H1H1_9STRA|nr:Ubiquitin carboxyl-terminal hydrolase 1 [Hondaea fermentalgiana]|eukprot:GBG34651.1 Ubiquitin carboxyl-terminal hydrolase 1 [Hondaea fermentalgiana]
MQLELQEQQCRHLKKKEGFKPPASLRALKRLELPEPAPDANVETDESNPACVCVTCGELVGHPRELEKHTSSFSHPVFVTLATDRGACRLVCTRCGSKDERIFCDVAHPVTFRDARLPKFLDDIHEWVVGHEAKLAAFRAEAAAGATETACDGREDNSEKSGKAKKAVKKERKQKKKKVNASTSNSTEAEGEDLPPAQELEDNATCAKASASKAGKLFGIANVGNSCFFNSVLQVLTHSPSLVREIVSSAMEAHRREQDFPEVDLSFTEAFAGILDSVFSGSIVDHGRRIGKRRKAKSKGKRDAWSDDDDFKTNTIKFDEQKVATDEDALCSVKTDKLEDGKICDKALVVPSSPPLVPLKRVHPSEMLAQIMLRAPQLGGFGQQDAHELLVEVLRALEEDEKALWEAMTGEDSASGAGSAADKSFTSYVWQALSTEVTREVRCLHCGHTSRRTEESVVTSLDVPDASKGSEAQIGDCIAQIQAETFLRVDDDNGLECENCSSAADAGDDVNGDMNIAQQESDDHDSLDAASGKVSDTKDGHGQDGDADSMGGLDAQLQELNLGQPTLDEERGEDAEEDEDEVYLSDDSDASNFQRSEISSPTSMDDASEAPPSPQSQLTPALQNGTLSGPEAFPVTSDAGSLGPEEDDEEKGAPGLGQGAQVQGTKPKIIKRDAVMTDTLSRAPPYLALHLKRFQTTFSNGDIHTRKIRSHVRVKEVEDFDFAGISHSYRLYGVVCHRGAGLNRGHYICYTRPAVAMSMEPGYHPQFEVKHGVPTRGKWWYASDMQVRPVKREEVLEDEAYLLFFERVDVDTSES